MRFPSNLRKIRGRYYAAVLLVVVAAAVAGVALSASAGHHSEPAYVTGYTTGHAHSYTYAYPPLPRATKPTKVRSYAYRVPGAGRAATAQPGCPQTLIVESGKVTHIRVLPLALARRCGHYVADPYSPGLADYCRPHEQNRLCPYPETDITTPAAR